jgi:hypothetical protein
MCENFPKYLRLSKTDDQWNDMANISNKTGGGKDSDWVHWKYWNGKGVDVCIMDTLFLKKKIKPKTLVPVSFPYSQQQRRYGLWSDYWHG